MSKAGSGIVVLPYGVTLQRVAPGLFLTSLTRPGGVWSELWDLWDLQQLIDELAAGLAD